MGDTVNTVAEGGQVLPRPAEEAAVLGAAVQDPAIAEGAARAAARTRMFQSSGNQFTTFVEGVIDGFASGFIHETGEAADERRAANPGTAMIGQGLGTALGLATGVGPVPRLAKGGEAIGKVAAQTALKQGEKAILTTAFKEAGAGAALAGAHAFGHQVLDTVIEDRPFSGEAIVDEMKLGGLIGFAGGGLMGIGGKLATRAEVAAQGGMMGSVDDALGQLENSRAAYGEALFTHEQQLGAMKEFRRAGKLTEVSDDFIRVREDAVRQARRAQGALKDMDLEHALSGKDPGAYKEFQRRWGEYHRAMEQVDDIFTPHSAERSAVDAMREPGTQVRGRAVTESAGPTGESQVAQTSSAPISPVQPGADYAVPASRVSEAIPDEAAYLSQYKTKPADVHASAAPEAGTVAGKTPPKPAPGLAELDEAIKQIPLRSARENAAAMATTIDSVPYGQVAKQLDAADAAAATKVRPEAPPRVESPDFVNPTKPEPSEVAHRLMDEWLNVSEPRVRPWFEAQARARAAMNDLAGKAGGRLDSARGLGVLEADGIRPSADNVGSFMDSVYAMNRAGHLVSAEARGVATPLRTAGKNAVVGLLGMKLLGAKAGIGLAGSFLGYGGRLAAATGRLYHAVTDSVAKFMTSTKVRSIAVAAGNHPWTYSERGPIADPVERIQEIKFLAANPESIRARIVQQAGELAQAAPEHVQAIGDAAVRQVTNLAIRAPIVYFDRLGRPLSPPQGKMRQFFEYENAVNDLPSVLKALASGSITKPQVDALQTSWTSVHVKVASMFLTDPAQLAKLDRAKLRVVEMVTGMPLTGTADPMFLLRQQAAWQPQTPPTPPGRPQAFNINPDGAPTPSQASASGRAPGN